MAIFTVSDEAKSQSIDHSIFPQCLNTFAVTAAMIALQWTAGSSNKKQLYLNKIAAHSQ